MSLTFNEKGINGDLSGGRVTVLNASDAVAIKTTDGKTAKLNAGDSVDATNGQTKSDDDHHGGGGWLIFALILGGAAAGIILASRSDNNRIALGGSTTIVSPTR